MLINFFLFQCVGIVLFFGSFLILTATNLIYSLIGLICTYIIIAGIFIFSGLDFLGFMLILVYIGAIAMLFLFVLMLFSIPLFNIDKQSQNVILFNIILGLSLFYIKYLTYYYLSFKFQISPFFYINLIELGNLVYSENYFFYIIFVGVFLLVVLFGLILIILESEIKNLQLKIV